MRDWHGEDRDVLILLRLSVLTGEYANYSQITTIGSSLLTQFMITLLKAFNTNTLNIRQYFKEKFFSHQPSHMYSTTHRINSNFNHSKMLIVPANSYVEQPTKFAQKLQFQVYIQKTN